MAEASEHVERIATAAAVSPDVVRRVVDAAIAELHGARDEPDLFWSCVAHSEGQDCCLDLLTEEDEVPEPTPAYRCPVCGATFDGESRTGKVFCDGRRIGSTPVDLPSPHLTTRCDRVEDDD